MIDPTIRKQRIRREMVDPAVAVLLLDVVLGYGSNEDPAGALIPEIVEAKRAFRDRGKYLPVVATVVGTESDPQKLTEQEEKLREAGVVVMPSNAQAVAVAGLIARRGSGLDKLRLGYEGD